MKLFQNILLHDFELKSKNVLNQTWYYFKYMSDINNINFSQENDAKCCKDIDEHR